MTSTPLKLRFDYLSFLPFWLRKQLFHRPKKGNYCNICGNHPAFWMWRGRKNAAIEKWEIVGAGLRKSDCCICGSSDRDRLVLQFIKQNFKRWKEQWAMETEEIRILHIAPEPALSKAIQNLFSENLPHHRIDYSGADKFAKGYYYAKRNTAYLDLDIPFKLVGWPLKTELKSDNSGNFHLILANHVLEHVDNLAFSINQLQHQLAANAKLLITLPIGEKLEQTIEITTLFPNFKHLPTKKQRELSTQYLGQWDHRRLMGRDYKFHFQQWEAFHINLPELNINPKEKLLIFNK